MTTRRKTFSSSIAVKYLIALIGLALCLYLVAHVAAWEHTGDGRPPVRHVEPLAFEYATPSQRSYK
jgi:hypothetical protein